MFNSILGSRLFLIVTVSTGLAYLAFFKYLDLATGAPAMTTRTYFVLLYLLSGVSSVLMGLNVLSFRSKLLANQRAMSKAASGSSSVSMSLSAGVISCFCHTSLLLPSLSVLGLSVISGFSVITALVEYQFWILVVFIAVNVYLVYRTLRRIQTPDKSGLMTESSSAIVE